MDLFNLSGRVAIIKGGARGIGFALAKGLASYGAVISYCGYQFRRSGRGKNSNP